MPARRWLALLITLLSLAGLAAAGEGDAEAAACREDLARRLKVPPSEVRVARTRSVILPDSALGLPRPGEAVSAVPADGAALLLESGPGSYLYTASAGAFRYGGPRDAWRYSALWLEPVPDEPNLNGNLMQVSLAGTNPELLLDLVEEFRPQPDGSLLASRRTSRSGHELLYLPPGQRRTPRTLLASFAFASPVLDPEGKAWAAFVRPRVGGPWLLVRNGLDAPPEEAARLELPPGARPRNLYWVGREPVIELDGERRFEWADGAWKELTAFAPPGEAEMQMNKSERLEVRTGDDGGRTVTRVLRVWFTGDERVIATLPDFEARETTLSPGFAFAVLSGGGKAFTVDLYTGEVLALPAGPASETRLLASPPPAWERLEGWFGD